MTKKKNTNWDSCFSNLKPGDEIKDGRVLHVSWLRTKSSKNVLAIISKKGERYNGYAHLDPFLPQALKSTRIKANSSLEALAILLKKCRKL